MSGADGYSRPAVAGSGQIACGLAAVASSVGEVRLLARSDASAWRAEEAAERLCGKLEGAVASRVKVTTQPDDLAGCDIIVEAIAEQVEAKAEVIQRLGAVNADADLASTTSSLSIAELGRRSGHADRLFGLHVFNPVTKMELIELIFPSAASAETRSRTLALCETFEKTPVEVPDRPGFVVNRLLFPYLFNAVRLLEETAMEPADIDTCMRLGAGHPMGPLALLDLVGLDVSRAIGQTIGETVPPRLEQLIGEGALGRKKGRGFHAY